MTNYSFPKTKSTSKDLDYYIGKRVKARRSSLGISQDKLGASLGVTFQQIQKYEKGINRISASTLYSIANALSVDFHTLQTGIMTIHRLKKNLFQLMNLTPKKRKRQLNYCAPIIKSRIRRLGKKY